VTFDETAPCPRGVFECAGNKEMEESIFVDEGLQGIDGDEDEPLLPSTSSLELVPTSTLEAEAPHATTSSTAAVEASRVEREIISVREAPSRGQLISHAFQTHFLLPSLSLEMLDTHFLIRVGSMPCMRS
jgi:hypothetical protein